MNCVICKHGDTHIGTTTVTLERDGTTIVFKHVPAQICENCGETYIGEDIARGLLETMEDAATHGVVVEIRHYAA